MLSRITWDLCSLGKKRLTSATGEKMEKKLDVPKSLRLTSMHVSLECPLPKLNNVQVAFRYHLLKTWQMLYLIKPPYRHGVYLCTGSVSSDDCLNGAGNAGGPQLPSHWSGCHRTAASQVKVSPWNPRASSWRSKGNLDLWGGCVIEGKNLSFFLWFLTNKFYYCLVTLRTFCFVVL